MNREATRYLAYEAAPDRAGINHALRNLQWLMREAFALGRLALLPPLELHPRHNLGVQRPWRWEDYFDLGASRLVDDAGAGHALPLVERLPKGLRARRIGAWAPAGPALRRSELLVRRMDSTVYAHDLAGGVPRYGFRMRPAARVLALAEPVLDALRARAPGGFAAVHVRRGDRLALPLVRRATQPRAVRRCLARVGVVPGTTVFVLSDERDPAWWAALAEQCDAVRSADFPALEALGAPGRPDNYLLYEVEKAVMRRAARRVETLPGDYERADATLVPALRWALARPGMLRHRAVRRARRAIAGLAAA